jgi:hypothetical protein
MDKDEFIPTLSHATERDIDLLLVEELTASIDFLGWITAKVGWNALPTTWRVLHSKRRTRNRREIDIHVELATSDPSPSSVLLIENKLGEDEQPEQGESYREELARIAPDCARSAMLLVCPESYPASHATFAAKFDAIVSYESIAAFLRARAEHVDGEMIRRLVFRADLLDQAIFKYRRGYTAVPNREIGSFNEEYVALLRRIAPSIFPGPSMLKDAPPDESVSMIYDHAKSLSFLPEPIRPTRFAHELGKGKTHRANYVAIKFPGWGRALQVMQDRMMSDTEGNEFTFAAKSPTKMRPNPGLIMSLATKPADNQRDFISQKAPIEHGIRTALRLQSWLRDNQQLLHRWREEVEAVLKRNA